MITDHNRRNGREVLLIKVGDDLMPTLLARFRIERHQVVVRGLEVEPIAIHPHAAVPDVGTAFGLPEIVPEHRAVAGVHSPGVVRHGYIQDAVYLQDSARDAPGAAYRNRLINFTADDRRRVSRARPGRRSGG